VSGAREEARHVARTRISVVGAGTMGELHARVVSASDRTELVEVVDLDEERARVVTGRWGGQAVLEVDPGRCDAVIVALPTELHAMVALPLLRRGIPLLVEKPLSGVPEEVRAILEVSAAYRVPLQCGFVERFNPVVRTLHDLLDGDVVHLLAVRHSPPAPRITCSVVADLLVHDLDLALGLVGGPLPELTGAASAGPAGGALAEHVDCTLRFPGGAIATLSASRIAQRKVRTLQVLTATASYELDLLRQDITIYRHLHHDQPPGRAGYRTETAIEIPFVSSRGEPLANQLEHFVDLVTGVADADAERRRIGPAHDLAGRAEALFTRTPSDRTVTLPATADRAGAAVVAAGA
jgi:predicted dehydrogenase